MINHLIRSAFANPIFAVLLMTFCLLGGWLHAPFDLGTSELRSPVSVDAIPNVGENQQIVFTEWMGQSPQDIEDQITYPLSSSLLGIPGVKTIRSSSIFGMSSIYIIFEDDIDFYWSRSRILEKLNSLPSTLLPTGVTPQLGPDATALGQIFWYTLELQNSQGKSVAGLDLHEIRTIQDFYIKYALSAIPNVAEVASIGGYVQEYQINLNPSAVESYNLRLPQILQSIQQSNLDIGANTLEINKVEYFIRGLGSIKSINDLESILVAYYNDVPIRLKDVADIQMGPASRRGVLDKNGTEVVGGVIVARHGSNPLTLINDIHRKIAELSTGLPRITLPDGTEAQLKIIPFYDRSHLIHQTLGTLLEALTLEILITILVIVVMLRNFRISIAISTMLVLAILSVFSIMKLNDVEANIVSLSGIAIAIGTMVDLGIVLCENIHRRLQKSSETVVQTILEGTLEVSGALVTTVATTILSFLPIFMMEGAEGKLFGPLAFTKTAALLLSLILALFVLPVLMTFFFKRFTSTSLPEDIGAKALLIFGVIALFLFPNIAWVPLTLSVPYLIAKKYQWPHKHLQIISAGLCLLLLLTHYWMPLYGMGAIPNFGLVSALVLSILFFFWMLRKYYPPLLSQCLEHPKTFLSIPFTLTNIALMIWLGFATVLSPVSWMIERTGWNIEESPVWTIGSKIFPGLGSEFMPSLDEGSFLLMPSSMPHAGMAHNTEVLKQIDALVNIPEVQMSVGKLGRVDSALDPAPISMYENLIEYKTEYALDDNGFKARFQVDDSGLFVLSNQSALSGSEVLEQGLQNFLISDPNGQYFRNWRPHIQNTDDIWDAIMAELDIAGLTSAPKLQPIETRLVMLQTGLRSSMGIKIYGHNLEEIEQFGLDVAETLQRLPSINSQSLFADRIIGKPYLLLDIRRDDLARYGFLIEEVQQQIAATLGGLPLGNSVEGREHYPIRLRYPQELRDDPNNIGNILLHSPSGYTVPLKELVDIRFEKGPQAIKSEGNFLVGYVVFDKMPDFSEGEVVSQAQNYLNYQIAKGKLNVPTGISYAFSGTYENQERAERKLQLLLPLTLIIIMSILYMQFRSMLTVLMILSSIVMALAGGFLLLWLYDQSWFLNIGLGSQNIRSLFHISSQNLSVAVWVGFIALFGIATDDGVLMTTYLDHVFASKSPKSRREIHQLVLEAASKRITPAIMTTVTTLIALLPVLTSNGRGSDVMIPMAIPTFGGMILACLCYFLIPVLYARRAILSLDRHGEQS